MTKAEAQKRVNQLRAIENGLETLVAMAKQVSLVLLEKRLAEAQRLTFYERVMVQIHFGVSPTQILPFPSPGKK